MLESTVVVEASDDEGTEDAFGSAGLAVAESGCQTEEDGFVFRRVSNSLFLVSR